jgi:hypothetical protein
MNTLKNEMLEFIAKPIPRGLNIIEKSVPVLFFGDIENARYATFCIKPSDAEFQVQRLVDRKTLNCCDDDPLTNGQPQSVYDSFLKYFQNNPFRGWFDPLNDMFSSIGVSYYTNSLVHFNICPWATSKRWSVLLAKERKDLISASGDWINKILKAGQIKYLFVNGTTALDYIENNIPKLNSVKTLMLDGKRYEIKCGALGSCKIISWGSYIQSGITTNSKNKLITEIQALL